jgi:redox-sensitive bicupin YhaK (pirin superfamily)
MMTTMTTGTSPAKQTSAEYAAVESVITPELHDLGGFVVRRALPNRQCRKVGPWVFFDHMGPASFPPNQGIDVRPHPHINLATVTYLFAGELLHRDSLGNEFAVKAGEVNLMIAGKGIVHSERQRLAVKASNNKLHGLQFWLALPEEDEETDPEVILYPAETIPQGMINGVAVQVLLGDAYGLQSPVKTFAETLCVIAALQPGQELRLPEGVAQRALYVAHGRVAVAGREIAEYDMAVVTPAQPVSVTAIEESRLVVIGGEAFSHRYMWWNFVSSRRERIEQAKQDWREGAFDRVPGDEEEFIPLPEGE